MEVKLVKVGGRHAGQEIPVPTHEFVIGRGQECQLQSQNKSVSRRHCAIIVDRHAASIEDFDSTNGTFVNGERVDKRHELSDGDRLRIGTLELDIQLGAGRRGRAKSHVEDLADDEENVICSVERSEAHEDTMKGKGLTLMGKRLTETAVLPLLPAETEKKTKPRPPAARRKEHDELDALRQQRRKLEHLLRSSDYERKLIGYEIHDGLAQHLLAANMQFQAYARLKDSLPDQAASAFAAGMAMLEQGYLEARRLIRGVSPSVLAESGVVAAIRQLVRDQEYVGGPNVEFQSKIEFNRLDSVMEHVIYRIVQEGLTNACKHSKSPRVRIDLAQHGSFVQIQVQDWGIGFTPTQARQGGFGLRGIRQRAKLLEGSVLVDSAPGKGARIVVDLPLMICQRPI
jgi:signal transduction histidine kinase